MITGNSIYLEKFTNKDFVNYYKLVSNHNVMAMITERALPIDEAELYFQQMIQNNELDEYLGSFKILEQNTHKFIGFAKLIVKEKDSYEAEIGYMLLPEYWGKKITSYVVRHLLKVAKEKTLLNKVNAVIDPNNEASRKILLNNGFLSVKICEMEGLPAEVFSLRL